MRLDEYEKHFKSSLDWMHDALTKFYVDVIDLAFTNNFRRGVFSKMYSVVLKDTCTDVSARLHELKVGADKNVVIRLG